MPEKIKIAILDDYQRVSGKFADWSVLNDQADITVFDQHEANEERLHGVFRIHGGQTGSPHEGIKGVPVRLAKLCQS